MGYQKQTWTVYDQTIPDIQQPNSFITKAKLDHIERGIESAITDLQMGTVNSGFEAKCELVTDENDPTIKRINMIIPKQVSWIFSEKELHDNAVSPIGTFPNDMILDAKGNVFTVVLTDGGYKLSKKMNIKGTTGISGPAGPQGLPGVNGNDGKDGKDGNKWVYAGTSMVEGDIAPESASVGDFVLDINGNIFEVLENNIVTKLLNIKGADGQDATSNYRLSIGEVNTGDTASAEITPDNKLNLTIPKGETGIAGNPGKDGNGIMDISATIEDKTITFSFLLDSGEIKTAAVTLP